MEKKFTRAMVCEEFKSKCRECPLNSANNFKVLPCKLLDESDINTIMKDYPYADVKVRMIFNDIETRLTAVEEKVEKKDKPKFTMFEVVDKKLYDKLEARHEADCRLISEYDLEIKKLKEQNAAQNDAICDLYSKLHTEQGERVRCEAVIVDKNQQIDEWKKRYKELEYLYEKKNEESNNLEDRYRRHNADLKSRLFDLKNAENERDHYKGLYSSKCDDYDKLLEKQLKTEKELNHAEEVGDRYKSLYDTTCDNYEKLYEENNKLIKENKTFNVLLINKTETIGKLGDEYDKLKEQKDHYKNLFHSLNHNYQNLVGELKSWKERATTAEKELDYLKMKNEKPSVLRQALETENKALRTACDTTSETLNKLKSEHYIIQENLKITKEKLKETEEKLNDARVFNKMREDVFNSNIKLQKIIEAKDREIGLLRAELDKYTPDDDEDYDID